ncbi:hypothetical protein V7457_12445 [Bacillus toyonensis]|nr:MULTISPECIES: hypothetical protein [Bacillus cereus group]
MKDVMGQLEYHLQIHDTTIILHKLGRRVENYGDERIFFHKTP